VDFKEVSPLFYETHKSWLSQFWSSQYILLVGLFVLWAYAPACVPTKEKVPPSPELTQAMARLETAQRLFQEQAYSEALAIYQDYLRRFPGGPMVDTALMEMGSVYMVGGNYAQARQAFQHLVSEYPKSPFVEDARINVIVAYYKEGNYGAAIEYASSALELATTPHQESRIHNLMGYSYSANKQFKAGIKSYMNAYQLAEPLERAEILVKMKEVITCLKEPELISLLDIYRDEVPGGYLRLQLAKEYELEDRIEPAMKVLSDFISLFPHHDELETAMGLMEELKSRLLVDRFSIGCVLPLSGPYSTVGNRVLMGIELALNQFNAQPDVNPIQLLIKDSKGDPNEAVRAVESLALKEGAIAVIGPMITSESAAIRAQALKVPIMTLTQKPDITKLGDYVFRNFLTPSLQVRAIVAYAVQELGIKKFAMLYPEESYGISFMNRFWDELILHGAEMVGVESYGPDQTDFADAIKKLVGLYYPRPEEPEKEDTVETILLADQPQEEKKEPEPIIDFGAVFIPDTFEKIGLIAPQFPYYDVVNVLMLGTNLWHSDKLIQMARGYVQGAIVPEGFFLNSPSSMVQGFVKSFEEVFGVSPGFLEAQAYDAATILFQLVNSPEVNSRRTLKTALMKVKDFPGVTGLTSFGETGDVNKQIYLLKIKGHQFVQIRP
jgi:branched-chain amino acid transport system substrate-binding protein